MIECSTDIRHIYKCDMATIILYEENGTVSIGLKKTWTGRPELLTEFEQLLGIVATKLIDCILKPPAVVKEE